MKTKLTFFENVKIKILPNFNFDVNSGMARLNNAKCLFAFQTTNEFSLCILFSSTENLQINSNFKVQDTLIVNFEIQIQRITNGNGVANRLQTFE
jgi:hypothetical protein